MGMIKMYQGLGDCARQRFRRAFLVALLIAGVTVYGFNQKAIRISLGFGTVTSADK
jgi:hypothetical protein